MVVKEHDLAQPLAAQVELVRQETLEVLVLLVPEVAEVVLTA
jgi:hypothetical protein